MPDKLVFFVALCATIQYYAEGLSGPNVCTSTRSNQVTYQESKSAYCSSRYSTKCGSLNWRRCTRYRQVVCYKLVTGKRTVYYSTPVCCSGYTQSGNECKPVCSQGCQHGKCSSPERCSCYAGYYGNLCSSRVQCSSQTNPKHGKLSKLGYGYYGDIISASCNAGYRLSGSSSRTCQHTAKWSGSNPICSPIACNSLSAPKNGLISARSGVYGETVTVSCKAGFTLTGSSTRRCEANGQWSGSHPACQDVNECSPKPCQNGGVCQNKINSFSCSCPSGFTGTFCEKDYDECLSKPCLNGGQCVDHPNGFSCKCAQGYAGVLCNKDVDECLSSPCVHGYCVDKVAEYKCVCKPGYTGIKCNQDIDECHSSPCYNGGTCRNGVNKYTCDCLDGYRGTDCKSRICCTYPPSLANGFPLDATHNCYGATVKYGCKAQYEISGSNRIKCGSIGWEGALSECKRKTRCSEDNFRIPPDAAKVCSHSQEESHCYIECTKPKEYLLRGGSKANTFQCSKKTSYEWKFESSRNRWFPPAKAAKCSDPQDEDPFAELRITVHYFTHRRVTNKIHLKSSFERLMTKKGACGPWKKCKFTNVRIVYGARAGRDTNATTSSEVTFDITIEINKPDNGQLNNVSSTLHLLMQETNDTVHILNKHLAGSTVLLFADGVNVTGTVSNVNYTIGSVKCPGGFLLKGNRCFVCPSGSYQDSNECLACPTGTYKDQEGPGTCSMCPPGFSTEYSGSNSSADCKELKVCPDGAVAFDSKCYTFSNGTSTYGAANKLCMSSGGYLATAKSKASYKFLTNLALSGHTYWQGLDDTKTEGAFIYSDGVPIGSYNEWAPGHPLNRNPDGSDTSYDCVAMDHTVAYMWTEHLCDEKHKFICEFQMKTY